MALSANLSNKSSTQKPVFVRNARFDDLKGTELFADVPDEAIEKLRPHSFICKLEAGKRLETSRGKTNYLYFIRNGFLAIWIPSCFDSKQKVFLAWRGPHQIIGELRQEGDTPSNTMIITCDECEFVEIPLREFFRVAAEAGLLYRNVANLLLRKVTNEGHRLEVVQMNSASMQVAQTLIHLAQDRCEDFSLETTTSITIPGTLVRTQMAAYAGIKRETFTRQLTALRGKNIISGYSTITILDVARLKKIAETKPEPARKRRTTRKPKQDVTNASTN
jgi:CRP-like cAMP-binding protein